MTTEQALAQHESHHFGRLDVCRQQKRGVVRAEKSTAYTDRVKSDGILTGNSNRDIFKPGPKGLLEGSGSENREAWEESLIERAPRPCCLVR